MWYTRSYSVCTGALVGLATKMRREMSARGQSANPQVLRPLYASTYFIERRTPDSIGCYPVPRVRWWFASRPVNLDKIIVLWVPVVVSDTRDNLGWRRGITWPMMKLLFRFTDNTFSESESLVGYSEWLHEVRTAFKTHTFTLNQPLVARRSLSPIEDGGFSET